MTLSKQKIIFQTALSEVYSNSEIAELFLIFSEELFNKNRLEIRRLNDLELTPEQEGFYKNILNQLKTGKPYQQILGKADFFGLKFFVNENVLIPRPETEELLELAIENIQDFGDEIRDLRILDIGTGSGVIPIVLKKYFPETEISAIDFSEEALEVAKKNADFHQTEINFIHQNYLEANLEKTYDVIISNPPYIAKSEIPEIENSVKDFEPEMALFSPVEDPLIFYRKIAADAKQNLSENGMIFLEINQKLGKETFELFDDFAEKHLIKDLSGNDRFVFVKSV